MMAPNHCRKSEINVLDAKTMLPDPVAVVELPNRVPYGFHAFFITEVCRRGRDRRGKLFPLRSLFFLFSSLIKLLSGSF